MNRVAQEHLHALGLGLLIFGAPNDGLSQPQLEIFVRLWPPGAILRSALIINIYALRLRGSAATE